MRRLARMALGAAWLVCLAALAMPGEVLHYDFESRTPTGLLRDLSGAGHHGRLEGGFAEAVCGDARGLRFNGRDTQIVPTAEAGLKRGGAFTLCVAFRFTAEDAKAMARTAPLLFGSTDALGVRRNYSLFFDYGRHLVLDVGNGSSVETTILKDVVDGRLHRASFVVAPPLVQIYCDGKCVLQKTDASLTPDALNGGGQMRLGRWHAGALAGELYDLRLFERALSHTEILRLAGMEASAETPRLELAARHSDVRRRLEWRVGGDRLEGAAPRELRLEVDGVAVPMPPLTAAEAQGGKLLRRGEADTSGLEAGRHRAVARLLGADGETLAQSAQAFEVQAVDAPEKYSNDLGISDEVLPPWTPMEVLGEGGRVVVSVWNRRYQFGDAPLALRMDAEVALFAGEAAMALSADGRDVRLSPRPLQVRRAAKHQVVLEQRAESPELAVAVLHTIDYDGFDRIQVALTARKPLQLDGVRFDFPLSPRWFQNAVRSYAEIDALASPRRYGFLPLLFLGDAERGLSYLADSDEFWFPKGDDGALSVGASRDGVMRFSMHPVRERVEMRAGERFTYEFGLAAAPFRPMQGTSWSRRYANLAPYCSEFTSTVAPPGGKSALDAAVEAGMRGFAVWRNGRAFGYPPVPGTGYCDELRKLVAAAHARGVKAFPYAIGFLVSDQAPEWNDERLYRKVPYRDYSARGDLLEKETGCPQHAYETCGSRAWQDLMLYRLRDALMATGADGVYLDSTADTRVCTEALHGHGYVGRDGKRHATYNGFATRDFLRRIHTLVHQIRGAEGVVDLHCSFAFHPAAAAWATSLWSGEGLHPDPLAFRALPPEHFRMAYTGRNIGVGGEFLHYALRGPYRNALALAVVHDTAVRTQNARELAELAAVWRQRDALRCDTAEFLGYWDARCPVQAREAGVLVSCYRRSDGRVVAVAANLTDHASAVTLEWRGTAAGAPPPPFTLGSQEFQFIELTGK